MKIVFFNYKEVEEKAVKEWEEQNSDIELVVTEEISVKRLKIY